jgi:hypothetical protein
MTKYTAEMNQFEVNAFLCIAVADVMNVILVQLSMCSCNVSATSVSDLIYER